MGPVLRLSCLRRAALLASLVLAACGGAASDDPGGASSGPADWISLSVNGGATVTYAEASGLSGSPPVACDPRVDWFARQIVLYEDYVGGAGTGFRTFIDLMFPRAEAVGTYTVAGDLMQATYVTQAGSWQAGPQPGSRSSGSLTVTRSDTRIEGTYAFQLVDGANALGPSIAGAFGVKAGVATSCP